MPTYVYRCPEDHCHAQFDVVKAMADIDNIEVCPACGAFASSACRQLTRTHFYGAKVEDAVFDPAFGKVIRDSKHRQAEAKARGYIELGNEPVEKVHQYFDKKREETAAQRWADADREKVYE